MNSIFDWNNFKKAFYSDGYQLGMQAAENQESSEILFASVANMYQNMDDLIESLEAFSKNQNQNIDCKNGCEWCCHQPVFALDYELDYLAHFIQNNFKKEKQKEIQKKAVEKNNQLKALKNDDLLNAKHPCPLLEKVSCLAYKARPMACRIYLSTNIKTCLKFYTHPEDKTSFPALMDFPMRAGRMMNEGFKSALKTHSIFTAEFRIEEKLITL